MRDKLIFGSRAMRYWFPDSREPNDTDYISRQNLISKTEQHYWVPSFQFILDNNKDDSFIDPDLLFTVKLSHFGWNIHWEKTKSDIIFLSRKGLRPNVELYRSLVKDWREIHGKKTVSMRGKNSKTFFEDAVKRKYNHDSLHEAIAFYKKPLYFRILKDPETESVVCSKEKFDQLSESDKVLLVLEETWVTALERFLIPTDFTYGSRLGFHHALKKMATTMSSGWMREYVHFNLDKIIKQSNIEQEKIINKFKYEQEKGTIKSA